MQHNAVLWDLDGTLVDSEEAHYVTWRDTLQNEGVGLSREEFSHMLGMRNDLIVKRLFEEVPSGEFSRRLGDEKEAAYREIVRGTGVTVLPGAREWLERLHGLGWRQMVASSAPKKNIEVVLEVTGLIQHVEGIISADEVAHGKPYPDIFIEAAKRLGVPPANCIVVEDAHVGIQAARAAGMKTIAVRTTHADVEGDIVVATLGKLSLADFRGLLSGDSVQVK